MQKHAFTAVELILVIVVLAIVVTITLVQVDKQRQAMLREESAANLRDLSNIFSFTRRVPQDKPDIAGPVIIKMSGPIWPKPSTAPGQMVPEVDDALVRASQRWNNLTAFISPAHPDAERLRKNALADSASAITDTSYWYIGYSVPNEAGGLAFIEAYRRTVEATGMAPTAWEFDVKPFDRGDGRMRTQLSTHSGVARNDLLHPQRTPVFIERPGLHDGGSNVLWRNGTVEFIPYPGPWPMTEKFIKALESLDELKVKE